MTPAHSYSLISLPESSAAGFSDAERPDMHGSATSCARGPIAPNGGYTRGLLGQASAPLCPRHGAVFELEQRPGPALLVPGCREQTSGLPGLTPVAAARVSARSAWTGRGRDTPGISPRQAPRDGGRQRPPRPGCPIPCHPVSPPGCTGPLSCYTFYCSMRNAKDPPDQTVTVGPNEADIATHFSSVGHAAAALRARLPPRGRPVQRELIVEGTNEGLAARRARGAKAAGSRA